MSEGVRACVSLVACACSTYVCSREGVRVSEGVRACVSLVACVCSTCVQGTVLCACAHGVLTPDPERASLI